MEDKLEQPVLYPGAYAAFLALATADIVLTWISMVAGAIELNPVADFFVFRWGLSGLIWLKFGSLVLVVLICEYVGRRRLETGRRLAHWAVALNAIPVAVTIAQVVIKWRIGQG